MKYFRLLSAGALLALLGPSASAQSSSINISTGINPVSSTLYPLCGTDQYWQITNIPVSGFTAPMCSVPITSGTTRFNSLTTARGISATCTQSALTPVFWGAVSGGSGYAPVTPAKYLRFTRRFFLNGAGTVRLTINDGYADDFFRLAFDAVTGTPIPAGSLYSSGTGSSTFSMPSVPFSSASIPMSAGWHTLDVDVYDIAAQEISLGIVGSLTIQNTTASQQPNNPCSWIPPSGNTCSDTCYWKVTGNNIINGNNIFGTLTKDDVRIQTNSANRGIFTQGGLLGWNTMSPSALAHINCSGNNPDDGSAGTSDVRFEKLEPGQGTVLVINSNGYVFDSKLPLSSGGGINNSCGSINQLPKVVDPLGNLTCSQIYDDGNSVGIGTTSGILGGSFTYNTSTPGQGSLLGTIFPTPPAGQVMLDVNGVTRGLAFLAISDARFKKNVRGIDNAMQIVNLLQPKTYDWNETARKQLGADNGRHVGFMAQELQQVLPELVIQDEKGNFAVNYTELIPILTQGQKELYNLYLAEKTKNEDMQQDIRELKSQLNTLLNCCASGKATDQLGSATDQSKLFQNVPNPFNAETVIEYYVAGMSKNAYVMIYDLNGRELKRLPVAAAGKGSVKLSSESMLSGMYIYSLIVDGREADSKRMVLIK